MKSSQLCLVSVKFLGVATRIPKTGFHSTDFHKEDERKNTWCNRIGIDRQLVKIKSSKLCSEHFSPNQFTSVHKIRLKVTALRFHILTNPGYQLDTEEVASKLPGKPVSTSTSSAFQESSDECLHKTPRLLCSAPEAKTPKCTYGLNCD